MNQIKIREPNEQENRQLFFATSFRVGIKSISQVEETDIVEYYVGTVRRRIVSFDGQWKFKTKREALETAKKYRQYMRDQLKMRGIDYKKYISKFGTKTKTKGSIL